VVWDGRDSIDIGIGEVGLIRDHVGVGVGEVDRAVRLHHHVIRGVEPASLEARCDHRGGAVGLFAGHAPASTDASDEAPPEVAREPVRPVGRLLEFDRALSRRVFPTPVAIDVTEQKVAALFPTHRTLGRPTVAADAIGKLVDRLADADDAVEFWRDCSILLSPLCEREATWTNAERGTTGCGRRQKLSAGEQRSHAILPCCAATIIRAGSVRLSQAMARGEGTIQVP
jgi:hypothetical protein